ncbi:MAG: zinc-dependent metalloprotease [Bacteroidetes bacterium]|nr:zinc-dependent metalloprotease [Bacteroidota bacterium]
MKRLLSVTGPVGPVVLAACLCLLAPSVFAQKKTPKDKDKAAAKADTTAATPDSLKGRKALVEKLKPCKPQPGLFTLYRDTTNGAVWILLRKDQLEKEYIHFVYSENGVVQAGHFRGNYQGSSIFKLQRYYGRVEIVKQNTGFYFDPQNALSKSADANISPAILASLKIVAEDSVKGDLLLSADDLFLSESMHQVKPGMVPGMNPLGFQLGSLNRDKSRIKGSRNYPANTDLVVDYTFDNPYPVNGGSEAVTDARAVTIRLQHSLIEVPQNTFEPRLEDPRVGYFSQKVNDMTTTRAANYHDPINRWHLVKKDPTAAVSEPVEPIVWWIENTTPVEYRNTLREAVLAWNEAFEAAGFRNAIQVNIQPDNADWDAGDIRYNVIRWTSSPDPLFGGYGPSFVNPRTGQILGADVMLEWVFVTNRLQFEKLMADKALSWEEVLGAGEETLHDPHQCALGLHLQHSLNFGRTFLSAGAGASDEELSDMLRQSLYYLALHEVGHTLGLMHNMKATQLHSPEQLRDKARTARMGLAGSVMDYPAIHVDPERDKQSFYYTTKPGPYDIWAIQYAYTPSLPNAIAEEARVKALLDRSGEPELAFGNDADDMRMPGKAIDPRVMIGDMSSDAIAYAEGRIRLAKELVPRLLPRYTQENDSYHELRVNFSRTLGEISTQAGVVSRYIGGVYVERTFAKQAGAKQPFTPVPAARQQQAMQLLRQQIFSPTAFQFPAELISHLQLQRRGFDFFGSTEDPKVAEMVLITQASVLVHILHPSTQQRILNSAQYGNTYTLNDVMRDLTQAIFQDDLAGNVNTYRQNLQALYVNYLIRVASPQEPTAGTHPHIAKAIAMGQLKQIGNWMQQYGRTGDAGTQAHRAYVLHTVEKSLRNKE